MIRAVIAEDEKLARERLKRLLKEFSEVDIVGEAANGLEAVEVINSLEPDLVFLDIEMPELRGTELIEHLECSPAIIFTTAYDQYAVKAFELGAVHYLLKPVTGEKLKEAVSRVSGGKQDADTTLSDLKKILSGIEREKAYIKTVTAKTGTGIRILKAEEIVMFKAEDRYVTCCTESGEFILDKTIKELADSLNPEDFFRIHRGVIVRLDAVENIKNFLFFNGYEVTLRGIKEPQPIGKTFLKPFRDRIGF